MKSARGRRRVASVTLFFVIAIVVWFGIGFLTAQSACAHDPRFICESTTGTKETHITDPLKSWAFYGHLAPGQSDRFEFTLEKTAAIDWSLLVDQRDRTNPARPSATLVSDRGRAIATLEFTDAQPFYEPFSRESYMTTAPSTVSLQPGRYTVKVVMRGGSKAQRYTFAIGYEERFGLEELPYVFGAIHRIRAQRY